MHLCITLSLNAPQPIVMHGGLKLNGPHLNNDAFSVFGGGVEDEERRGAKLIKHINQPTLLAPRPDFDQLWSLFDEECHQCLVFFRLRLSHRVHVEAAVPCLLVPSGQPD